MPQPLDFAQNAPAIALASRMVTHSSSSAGARRGPADPTRAWATDPDLSRHGRSAGGGRHFCCLLRRHRRLLAPAGTAFLRPHQRHLLPLQQHSPYAKLSLESLERSRDGRGVKSLDFFVLHSRCLEK